MEGHRCRSSTNLRFSLFGAARAPNIDPNDDDDDDDDDGPELKAGLLYTGAASRRGRLLADCRPACSLTCVRLQIA